jgi:DNA-directed RNA polymerase subunit RPC12/RpoP
MPFKCPDCGAELWPVGVSVVWLGGGATKYKCTRCRKEWWHISGYGYVDGNLSVDELPKPRPYLKQSDNQQLNLSEFF